MVTRLENVCKFCCVVRDISTESPKRFHQSLNFDVKCVSVAYLFVLFVFVQIQPKKEIIQREEKTVQNNQSKLLSLPKLVAPQEPAKNKLNLHSTSVCTHKFQKFSQVQAGIHYLEDVLR